MGPTANAPTPAPKDSAPWYYRKRFAVFGAVYGLAFFFGFLITGLAGIPAVPLYRAFGFPVLFASLAVLFVGAGLSLRVLASSYLSSAVMWHDDPQSPQLRVSGPYRFTRNPLYLGNILQAIGIGLVTPWPVAILIVAGVATFDYALIFIEEPFLSATQGIAYERYRASVPRLIPLPGKVAPAGSQLASVREGLRAELWVGFLAAAVFAAALIYSSVAQASPSSSESFVRSAAVSVGGTRLITRLRNVPLKSNGVV